MHMKTQLCQIKNKGVKLTILYILAIYSYVRVVYFPTRRDYLKQGVFGHPIWSLQGWPGTCLIFILLFCYFDYSYYGKAEDTENKDGEDEDDREKAGKTDGNDDEKGNEQNGDDDDDDDDNA